MCPKCGSSYITHSSRFGFQAKFNFFCVTCTHVWCDMDDTLGIREFSVRRVLFSDEWFTMAYWSRIKKKVVWTARLDDGQWGQVNEIPLKVLKLDA